MKLIIFFFTANLIIPQARAMMYGVAGCVYPNSQGRLDFISNVPGCTEKSRKSLKDGELVTFQMTAIDYSNPTKPQPKVTTTTMRTVKTGNKISSLIIGEGSDLNKAPTVTTYTYNSEAFNPLTALNRTTVKINKGRKSDTFVTYDRDLCARLDETHSLDRDLAQAQLCATILSKYDDVINEFSKKFSSQKLKLGYYTYNLGFNGSIASDLAEVRSGRVMDTVAIMVACKSMKPSTNPYGFGMPAPEIDQKPLPAPKEAPAQREVGPDEA